MWTQISGENFVVPASFQFKPNMLPFYHLMQNRWHSLAITSFIMWALNFSRARLSKKASDDDSVKGRCQWGIRPRLAPNNGHATGMFQTTRLHWNYKNALCTSETSPWVSDMEYVVSRVSITELGYFLCCANLLIKNDPSIHLCFLINMYRSVWRYVHLIRRVLQLSGFIKGGKVR